MTMRIKFSSKQSERQSTQNTSVITDVYKATLVDIDKQAFVTLKSHKNKRQQFSPGEAFVIDKVKLVINPKVEIVLVSTSLTVLRSESEDSFTVESLELS